MKQSLLHLILRRIRQPKQTKSCMRSDANGILAAGHSLDSSWGTATETSGTHECQLHLTNLRRCRVFVKSAPLRIGRALWIYAFIFVARETIRELIRKSRALDGHFIAFSWIEQIISTSCHRDSPTRFLVRFALGVVTAGCTISARVVLDTVHLDSLAINNSTRVASDEPSPALSYDIGRNHSTVSSSW